MAKMPLPSSRQELFPLAFLYPPGSYENCSPSKLSSTEADMPSPTFAKIRGRDKIRVALASLEYKMLNRSDRMDLITGRITSPRVPPHRRGITPQKGCLRETSPWNQDVTADSKAISFADDVARCVISGRALPHTTGDGRAWRNGPRPREKHGHGKKKDAKETMEGTSPDEKREAKDGKAKEDEPDEEEERDREIERQLRQANLQRRLHNRASVRRKARLRELRSTGNEQT